MNRRSLFFTTTALALATLGAGTARAQGVDEFGAYGDTSPASDQYLALEVRFGPYLPNVDDEFSDAAPFEETFGNDNRYLLGLEVDWQALRIPNVGSFGPGIGWGYTTMSAGAPFADGTGLSEQETSLSLMPMYLVGVFRVDALAQQTPVPLAAYAKAGLGYALWWVSDGAGTAEAGDVSGRGASYGYQFALGGMLLLDALDRESAVRMDAASGINNSYFFIEWYFSRLDGFGAADQMQVGTSTWMLGLVFEI